MVEAPEVPGQRRWLAIALGGALLIVAAAAVVFAVGSSGGAALPPGESAAAVPAAAVDTEAQAEPAVAVTAPIEEAAVEAEPAVAMDAPDEVAPAVADDRVAVEPVAYTGAFDIIVEPAGAKVLLDGKELGAAPLRVGRLATGAHTIEIVAPDGYEPHSLDVELPPEERQVFEVALELSAVAAQFASEPAGATVTLIADGEPQILGESPADAELDPNVSYQVVFSLEGYGAVTRNVDVEPGAVVEILAVMKRGSAEASAPAPAKKAEPKRRARSERRERNRRSRASERKRERAKPAAAVPQPKSGKGVLMLGAKPPCQIYIDGRNTGLTTPQRSIQLSPGKHRVTLVNREFGIQKTYAVKIHEGKTTRMIKDLSGRLD